LQERLDLEDLLETVAVSYYDIVQLKQRLHAIELQLSASSDRARLAQAKLEVGAGSKLEQLQALADLNQDSSTWLDQTLALRSAKVRLNQELARDPALEFEVADSIPLDPALPLDAWRKELGERNAAVAYARAQKGAAEAGLAVARGRWFPTLSANVAYATTPDALNEEGAIGRDGASYGVKLSVPLFDRLATPVAVKQARIEARSGATRVAQAESQAAADFEVARRRYELGMTRIGLETRNLQVARLQAEAAQARYKLGASSPLEFRDAQTRLLDAEGRLITARQSAKQAELALRRLAGRLVAEAGK
jgi:outer membrane protein TolC